LTHNLLKTYDALFVVFCYMFSYKLIKRLHAFKVCSRCFYHVRGLHAAVVEGDVEVKML